jgi:hypothetical protein
LGLSRSEATELGAYLGFDAGAPNIISLNGQISQKLGQTVSISFQRQEEQELILSNDQAGYYRLFGIWHLVEELTVDTLLGGDPTRKLSRFDWGRAKTTSFIENSSVQVTYADVSAHS